jgi:hypothetical protein
MRVFHFVRADYGLENIQHRRHKIAIRSEVNDPFEFISMDTSNKTLRQSIQFLRANMDHSCKRVACTHGLVVRGGVKMISS